MSDLVVIRLGYAQSDSVAWGAFTGVDLDAAGSCEDASGLIEDLRDFGDSVRYAAILPGEQAAMRHFPSPPKNAEKFAAAARLLLEDELAQSVDECHVATHAATGTGKIFAVDDAVMRGWVSFFAEAGMPLSAMTIDYECLGGVPEHPVLFLQDERVIASYGDYAFAAEKSVALDVLNDLFARFSTASVSVYSGPLEQPPGMGDQYRRIGNANDETLLCAAAKAIAGGSAANLLQGAHRPRRRAVDLSPWRRPAIAAGILALTLGAAFMADGFRTRTIAERYDAGAHRLHEEYFPDAANIDPRSHARAVLSSGAGASFLAMSAILGRASQENENVSIDRIRFDEARGQFVFSIRSASDADIEKFRNSLAAHGLPASETGGYRRSGAYWVGEMAARL